MIESFSSIASGGMIDPTRLNKDMFNRTDANGDKKVSLDEFAAQKPADAPVDAPDSSELFSQFDSDGDGYLTEQELSDGAQSMGPPPPPPNGGMSDSSMKSLLEILAELEEEAETESIGSSTTESEASAAAEEELAEMVQAMLQEYRAASGSYQNAQEITSLAESTNLGIA